MRRWVFSLGLIVGMQILQHFGHNLPVAELRHMLEQTRLGTSERRRA